MLRFKNITFCNIGRFVTEQTIDFTGFGNLIQIKGVNNNTGGSSGASKSTIFNAIDYLLGINDTPTTALQSRLTKNSIYVEGEFDVDGTVLVLKRSKKDGFYLKHGDEEISGNIKLAEERLEQIIGIPTKLFKKTIHKKQKDPGFFLNLTAKESYEFLMKALNLESLISDVSKIDDNLKLLNSRVSAAAPLVVSTSKHLEDLKTMKNVEQDPSFEVPFDFNQSDIDAMEVQISNLESDIRGVNLEKNSKVGSIVKPLRQKVEAQEKDAESSLKLEVIKQSKNNAIASLNLSRKEIQSKIDKTRQDIGKVSYARSEMTGRVSKIKLLMSERTQIESGLCPTCNQSWVTGQAKIEHINAAISSLKTEVIENKAIIDGEELLKASLEEHKSSLLSIEQNSSLEVFDKQIELINQEIAQKNALYRNMAVELENNYLKELNQYDECINSIQRTYSDKLNSLNVSLVETRSNFLANKQQMAAYALSLKSYKTRIDSLNALINTKQSELDSLNTSLENSVKSQAIAEESKRLIKSYTLQIFQDTLDYIGSRATDMLSSIPNMHNATIFFEGCRENQSGSIKDEVNAIVNLDGYADINIKTLSGGERTALDMAVDLSVIDMIEDKTGKGVDFFIMDEPFNGLEEVCITQCLEILKQIDSNKRIIIVDHNPIINEMITEKIIVERTGEESVVL